MAQLERSRKPAESPQTPRTSPISRHRHSGHHHEEYASPNHSMNHMKDNEDHHANHHKKSVLTKVKERAQKLKHNFSVKKRHGHEHKHEHEHEHRRAAHPHDRSTQEDSNADDKLEKTSDDDPEYLGAPMYESEAAPEILKENARQHPRAKPVLPKNNKFPENPKHEATNENNKPANPNMTPAETTSNQSGNISPEIAGLTITPEAKQATASPAHTQNAEQETDSNPQTDKKGSEKDHGPNKQEPSKDESAGKDHGPKKQEPRKDETAASQAVKDGNSSTSTKSTGEVSMVDKVKEAVYSVFGHHESSNSTAKPANSSSTQPTSANNSGSTQQNQSNPNANSAPVNPPSANAQEGNEEQTHGKILQAN